MNLVIDIGNSRIKAAIFSGGEIVERWYPESLAPEDLEAILDKYPRIHSSILSSTRNETPSPEHWLAERMRTFVPMGPNVATPLDNLYSTPDTLGPDRLAAAVGANHLYPGRNLMVVDFGTAITIDTVTAAGEYLGGNISPGARTRFRALSDYTARLPMGRLEDGSWAEENIIGKSTQEAIYNGVVNGILFELEGYMSRLEKRFGELSVIFTGGEADFFADKLKNTIFANYDLVLIGLNTILEHNANKK